jgi:transcriptional regulator with XRE-family HTH domain
MSSTVPASLGRRLADCREQLGWTQKMLAEKAGLSVTFVSEIENNRRSPGTEALLSLADALGSSLDYLVKGATQQPPPRRALLIPAELAEAADEEHIPLSIATDLVRWNDMVVARRSRGGEPDKADHSPSKEDWKAIYKAYRRLSGED